MPRTSLNCLLYVFVKCSCESGWSGSDCSSPVCDSPCLNDGACIKPNQCQCPAGFTGTSFTTKFELPSLKFQQPTRASISSMFKNFERQKGNFCQLSNSDSLQCSYSSHVLKTFTNQFVQFKRARESGLECTTKIFESHDAQVTYRYISEFKKSSLELIQQFLHFLASFAIRF